MFFPTWPFNVFMFSDYYSLFNLKYSKKGENGYSIQNKSSTVTLNI